MKSVSPASMCASRTSGQPRTSASNADEIAFRLAGQPDLGEDRHRKAQRLGRESGVIAADETGFLERAHAPQTRRRGDTDAAGELDIGHAPVRLQMLQDAAVDTVEFDPPHPTPSLLHTS